MGEKATQVLAAAAKHGGERWGPNDCAKFVSQVFSEAGYAKVFKATSSVPTLAGEFAAAQKSATLADAQPADLIVFGKNEHVMIYFGNNQVVGTLSDAKTGPNASEVLLTDVGAVKAPSGAGFSLVLETGMAAGQNIDLNPVDAANAVAAATANAITSGFATAFAWVPGFALNAGILLFAAVLVWAGLKETIASTADG